MPRRKQPQRPFIDEDTMSIGTGPLDFDVVVARAHGWTDKAIERVYKLMAKMVSREWNAGQRRYPERYRRHKTSGDILFIGKIGTRDGLSPNPKEWKKL